jgi:hypothetical protein
MIQQNSKISLTEVNDNAPTQGYYLHIFFGKNDEVAKLYKKYGGLCSVQIGKPEKPGTEKQNRLTHKLIEVWFFTGMHSSDAKNPADFKLYLKREIGVCRVVDYKGEKMLWLKSWADYNRSERIEFIDRLIKLIELSGAAAECKDIHEILTELDKNKLEV